MNQKQKESWLNYARDKLKKSSEESLLPSISKSRIDLLNEKSVSSTNVKRKQILAKLLFNKKHSMASVSRFKLLPQSTSDVSCTNDKAEFERLLEKALQKPNTNNKIIY